MLNKLMLLAEVGDVSVNVGEAENGFCAHSANVWQTVGYILLVFKIVIPILLIIFGMIDLGKAVIASKDDEIKKATTALLKRAVAAVVIFFVPTIIGVLMGVVGNFAAVESDFDVCRHCISGPTSPSCEEYAKPAWEN